MFAYLRGVLDNSFVSRRSLHDLVSKAIGSLVLRSFGYIGRHSIGHSDFFAVFVVGKNMKSFARYGVKAVESSVSLNYQFIYNSLLIFVEYG